VQGINPLDSGMNPVRHGMNPAARALACCYTASQSNMTSCFKPDLQFAPDRFNPLLIGGVKMAANSSFDIIGMQEIAAEQLQSVSGGAYFWDDFAGGTGTSGTDTGTGTGTNLIPLPR
jgi:hypothetical protein